MIYYISVIVCVVNWVCRFLFYSGVFFVVIFYLVCFCGCFTKWPFDIEVCAYPHVITAEWQFTCNISCWFNCMFECFNYTYVVNVCWSCGFCWCLCWGGGADIVCQMEIIVVKEVTECWNYFIKLMIHSLGYAFSLYSNFVTVITIKSPSSSSNLYWSWWWYCKSIHC